MDQRQRREIEARNRNAENQRKRSQVDSAESTRHEIALLAEPGCVAVECGVDTGQFSKRLWNTGQFKTLHSVDKWDDIAHPETQYWAAAEVLMPLEGVKVWHMTAQQFAKTAQYAGLKFGFIYMDCYAHTGQDDGGVLRAMWEVLEPGGIFAGDDYDKKQWPDNWRIVNEFTDRVVGCEPNVFDQHLTDERPKYDGYASWWIRKPSAG